MTPVRQQQQKPWRLCFVEGCLVGAWVDVGLLGLLMITLTDTGGQ